MNLDKDGFTLIPGALTTSQVAELRATLNRLYETQQREGRNYPGIDPAQACPVFNLHNKADVFLPLLDHPAIWPLLTQGLGEDLILHYFNARSPKKNCAPQPLHLDCRVPIPSTVVMLQTIWMIDDFTVENGATKVVPGSHKRNERPQPNTRYPEEISVTGKAGDVFVYNSGLWHGAGPSTVEARRWGIITTYSRWFIKPSMDFTRNTPPALYRRLSPRLKQLLGFTSMPPCNEEQRIKTIVPVKSLPEDPPEAVDWVVGKALAR